MAGLIAKEVLEEIRLRNDIADVIGRYFQIQKAGATFKALCPFHKEKTPSFTVNPQRQIFHCFGCGAGGDVFKFIMQIENVDFMTAVRMLAEKTGVVLELESGPDALKSGEKNQLFKIHAEVTEFFHHNLLQSPEAGVAREYLTRRGIDQTIIDEFQFGFALQSWDRILVWARTHKYSPELLEKAGLLIKSDRPSSASPWYDRFRNRIMIPIRDEQGRVIAFTGRTLSTDDQTAKYVNSPETPLFRKSHILFALDRARTALVESREAIICEGQIDVIRCHSAGFKSAVASQGTAFTEDHARILRRYVDSIVLVFDPDHAGQEAAVRTAGIFVQAGLSVRIARLPPKSDPDSFILTKGAAPFAAILKAASSAIDFLVDLNLEREDPHSETGLRRIEKNLIEFLKLAPSAVQRDQMIVSAGRRLQIHPDDLRRDLKAAERTFQRKSEPPPDSNPSPALPSLPEEIELAFYLAAHPELAELLDAHLPLHLIQDSQVRRFIEAVRISRQDQQPLMSVILDRDDADRSLGRFAADILSRPVKSTGDETSPREIVEGLLMAIWRRELKRRRTKLEQTLLKADLDPDGRHEVETEIHRLTPEIKQLTRWETAVKTIAAHRAEE